ncbi:MAG TPA: CGNR zinc finger domain-containing protein [Ktedonobacteraceae bacterium]|jgi:predicted RNA-binding Zn ribbon-like protein|nr:CGNR zinc finger domain-containing protein [Ktedonobacteraceae bacterium]
MSIQEEEAAKSSPESLRLVQECLNTNFSPKRADEWEDPEQLRSWLLQRQLFAQDHSITRSDYQRLLEVRAAIRELVRFNSRDHRADPAQIEALNHLAQRAPLLVTFQQDGQAKLKPEAGGVDGVIATLFADIVTAMDNGTWNRLKICRNERCGKAFYDVSKNRSGTWCLMARCGSRAKAKAYQQRQKQRQERHFDH